LTQIGRAFALSEIPRRGIYCGEQGAFVGEVALLIKQRDPAGSQKWTVRSLSEINRDLSKQYGVPVEFKLKAGGFATIARALDRGDMVLAQLAMLHLQLPDPPLANTVASNKETARKLLSSGLLKADWNPDEHPRWPRGTPSGIGGEFAPKDTAGNDPVNATSDVKPSPVQLTIPAPIEIPGMLPPSEILPVPLAPPNINPLHVPQNPYPERPKCVEEWAQATEYCMELVRKGWLGRGAYRGMGKTLSQCIIGQVSEDCGGNSTGA
jgi:hypothetical protein